MLTSPRKLQKLFIKFVSWGATRKAEKLIQLHPNLEIPWQKAFEDAIINRYTNAAEWIWKKSIEKGFRIDVHSNSDNLMKQLIASEKVEQIRLLIKLSMSNGNEWWKRLNLEGEQTPGTRKLHPHILELFTDK